MGAGFGLCHNGDVLSVLAKRNGIVSLVESVFYVEL